MSSKHIVSPDHVVDYEAILNAFHEDIVVVDRNGVIVRVSPLFENIYGMKAEEAIGKTVFYMEKLKIFNPSVAKKVFETGEKATVVQKNKKGRSVLIAAVPIKNESGEIIYVASYSFDVTDLQILEEEHDKLKHELMRYSEELNQYRTQLTGIADITNNLPGIQNVNNTINKVAQYDTNILITGESGVGKTTFARLIHAKSNRSGKPFVEISCGAIPENLLESELFGYEKGAFTGANQQGKIGLIEMADQGTLFLDEISELPLNLQVKMLKVLQDKRITKVGGNVESQMDFRLVAATNKNLAEMVAAGKFREDLYYRLNVIPLDIPPLRKRSEDTLQLTLYFVKKFNEKYGQDKRLSNLAFNQLLTYDWPGNIRQLENFIERLVITSDQNLITEKELPNECRSASEGFPNEEIGENYDLMMEEYEKKLILEAVSKYHTTVKVAEKLGISQSSAARKIKKFTETV